MSRVFRFVWAAALACSILAQVNQPPNRPQSIDLNGIWQGANATSGTPLFNGEEKILIFQIRNSIQLINVGGRRFIRPGDRFLTALFPPMSIAPAQFPANIHAFKPGGAGELIWMPTTVSVDDADHIRIAKVLEYRRAISRQIADVPCQNGNPLHVSGEDAYLRGNAYFELKDIATANCWYRLGAIEGYARAQSSYAYALLNGRGVKKDLSEAQDWAEKSAANHDPYGESIVAELEMRRGFGLGFERAKEYRRRYAEHNPDAAYMGIQTPERTPTMPAFAKDKVFTYDLSGEWRVVLPARAGASMPILVNLTQHDGDIRMVSDSPNRLYPLGKPVFIGKYTKDHLTGLWMDAPAHLTASGEYAATQVDVQIQNPTNLISPAGIRVTRSDELGANKACDATKYAGMDQARTFVYATKDFELKNYGNAACWMYVSAMQGHHEAQFEMAAFLDIGFGVTKNDDQSFLWAKKSAENGNKKAQRFLAHCYEVGIGVHPDTSQASLWKAKAADGKPEPELPETTEQALYGLMHIVMSTVCGTQSTGHMGRVSDYISRGMTEGKAERAARGDESETAFLCSGYHPR